MDNPNPIEIKDAKILAVSGNLIHISFHAKIGECFSVGEAMLDHGAAAHILARHFASQSKEEPDPNEVISSEPFEPAIQVNGKPFGTIRIPRGWTRAKIIEYVSGMIKDKVLSATIVGTKLVNLHTQPPCH